jgi:hypothetical protein
MFKVLPSDIAEYTTIKQICELHNGWWIGTPDAKTVTYCFTTAGDRSVAGDALSKLDYDMEMSENG